MKDFLESHFSKLWKVSYESFAGKSSFVGAERGLKDIWTTLLAWCHQYTECIWDFLRLNMIDAEVVTFVMHNPFSPFLFFFKLGHRIWKGVKVLNIMMDGSKTDIVRFYGLTSAGRNAFVTRFSYSIAAVCSSNEWVIPTRIRTPWFVITNRVLL